MYRLEFLRYLASLAAMWCISPLLKFRGNEAGLTEKPGFTKEDFGKDFYWGVATSAHQIEGAWKAEGKGESNWDHFAADGNIKDKTNGREAIDFYNRYKGDLGLLKELNFQNFRFSFSWSRILPEGYGRIGLIFTTG